MKKIYSYTFILTIGIVSFLTVNAQSSRGVGVRVKTNSGETKEIKLYERSYALVIGNSQYTNGWDNLAGVKSDVLAVSDVLREQGFQVETSENLTRRQFNQRMNRFIDDYGFKPNNRLLIYYAGHGHTLKSAGDGRQQGYIVPVDAPNPRKSAEGFKRKAIRMDDIQNFAKRIESKHALFIFDSCFSGKLVTRSAIRIPPIIEEKVARPVRQFITAGAADQPVPDVSIFRRAFVNGLRDRDADSNRDGYITGTELAEYLKEQVTNSSNRVQTPQYGKINDINLNRGDFVFVTGKAGTVASGSEFSTAPSNTTSNPQATSDLSLNSAVAFADKAFAEIMHRNADKAKDLANRALRLERDQPLALGVRGWAKFILTDFSGAREDLEKASKLDPKNPMFQARLIYVYAFLNEKNLAESSAANVVNQLHTPSTKHDYYFRAMAKNYLKKYDEAITDYTKAIDMDPKFAVAINDRGNTYFAKREVDLAMSAYSKTIEINPDLFMPYSMRGRVYLVKGEYNLAIGDLSKAIELNPKLAEAYNFRGLSFYNKKQFDSAIADFTKAIEINPTYYPAYNGRGLSLHSRKEYVSAISDYTKSIEINPSYSSAFKNRGHVHYLKKRNDMAIADYSRAVEINPKDVNAYFYRGNTYYFKKDYDLAISDYNNVLKLNSKFSAAYYNLGLIFQRKNQDELAEKNFRKAAKCQPNNKQVALFTGVNYSQKCVTLDLKDYPSVPSLGLSKNSIFSIIVGSDVKAVIYRYVNLTGPSITIKESTRNSRKGSKIISRVHSIKVTKN